MGEVYAARDTRLDRRVAVKVLAASLQQTPEMVDRFEREARAVASLSHPHICVLHDVGQAEVGGDQVRYLVMEHLEGETLAARIGRGRGPLNEALVIAAQIANALDAAHRAATNTGGLASMAASANGTLVLSAGGAQRYGPVIRDRDGSVASALDETLVCRSVCGSCGWIRLGRLKESSRRVFDPLHRPYRPTVSGRRRPRHHTGSRSKTDRVYCRAVAAAPVSESGALPNRTTERLQDLEPSCPATNAMVIAAAASRPSPTSPTK
jgi:hypothetical protein